jgi:hydroxyacylglutathione hydrolase
MLLQPFKSEGIAHLSYLVGSEHSAAVIDPRRDCQEYIERARQEGMRITHIFETHRNEDYTIGSLELAQTTGAEIHHGHALPFRYGNKTRDGDRFRIGNMAISVIETPGHTYESICLALADHEGEDPVAVFTGDTLFVQDVGRIDFYGPQEAPSMAGALYDSIFERLLPLGDEVLIFPAHGAGSVCAAGISDRETSTLGLERKRNPVLWNIERDDFIRYKVAENHYLAPYFKQMEVFNLQGPAILGGVPKPPALGPGAFAKAMEGEAMVIDARMPAAYGGAHIPGSYSIWLDGVPNFAGWVLPYDKPILLVTESLADVEQAVRFLIRIGYDNIAGFLRGGAQEWFDAGRPVEHLELLTAHQLHDRLSGKDGTLVLDVRRENEWLEGHIAGAQHIYVGHLEEQIAEVPDDRPVATICATGRRASLAASILLRAGRKKVANVIGSMSAWNAAGFPVTNE